MAPLVGHQLHIEYFEKPLCRTIRNSILGLKIHIVLAGLSLLVGVLLRGSSVIHLPKLDQTHPNLLTLT